MRKTTKTESFCRFRNSKRISKKASLSLSVNAIIVLILAIVMLGLGLGFIRGMFSKVSGQIEQQISVEAEPSVPTSSEPITLSREMIITHAADKEIIKVGIYNPSNENWNDVKPKLTCDGSISTISESQSANTKTIKQGQLVTFNLLITIPSSAPNTFLCQMNIVSGETDKGYEKDLAIKIIE